VVIKKSMFVQVVFKMSTIVDSDGLGGQHLLQFYPRSCGMTPDKQKAKTKLCLWARWQYVYKWAS
jgi:hypothetical protein